MKTFSHRLAFVVPTIANDKGRPQDLRRLLGSIRTQSVSPEQIIIVDASKEPLEQIVRHDEFSDLKIDYARVYPPSLSKQRNAGMQRLDPTITLAGYLDDDLVLESGALEAMLDYWEDAPPDLGGVSFNIVNTRLPRGMFLKSLFLTDSTKRGIVLRSGYQASLWPVTKTLYVQWLCGGATIWRRGVIERFQYDEWFDGTGYLEDVDYSYRVGKKYKLAIVGHARAQHFSLPIRKEINYILGKWQIINRMYFVKKNRELSVPLCYWAFIGQIVVNVGKALVNLDSGVFARVLGNIMGMRSLLTGRLEKIGGIYK